MTTQEQIIELSKKWYEYVGKNHHKDRDCHWYIETDFAYGDKIAFTACHYGYVFEDFETPPPRSTYEDAEGDLLELIKEAIKSQKEWIDRVLANPKWWDEEQIEQAKTYYKLFK